MLGHTDCMAAGRCCQGTAPLHCSVWRVDSVEQTLVLDVSLGVAPFLQFIFSVFT